MRIALAPLNPTVGDVRGNADLVAAAADRARELGADLLLTPELAISGYPPRDLLYREAFVEACAREAHDVAEAASGGLTLVVGSPLPLPKPPPSPAGSDESPRYGVTNSLVVYRDGDMVARYDKRLLPTYDVFDEDRYFTPGSGVCVIEVDGRRVGLMVCEDLWRGADAGFAWRYTHSEDPVAASVRAGAEILLSASASPFVLGKSGLHGDVLRSHATRHGLVVASVNQLGGNDDLVFDGHCRVYDHRGRSMLTRDWSSEIVLCDLDEDEVVAETPERSDMRELWTALTVGVRDYLAKTGFGTACLGLSGGIDSALTAAVACAAIGAENVTGIRMPGAYSSEHSLEDAADLAERLGMRCETVPIEPGEGAGRGMLDGVFERMGERGVGESLPDVTEENLQSRVRGLVMMGISNRTGALLLTTGNKSELAVGYCTLYGDMNGGLAVLSDVPKTVVFELSRWINEHFAEIGFAEAPIPTRTIEKPPSAELRPDQKDTDSLPEYEVLDEIIRRHEEERQSVARIVRETGLDSALVGRVARLIRVNEYKRRQLAVGIKVTSVAYGSGRRMPIAARWSGD